MIASGLATVEQAIFDLDFHAVMHWGDDPAAERRIDRCLRMPTWTQAGGTPGPTPRLPARQQGFQRPLAPPGATRIDHVPLAWCRSVLLL